MPKRKPIRKINKPKLIKPTTVCALCGKKCKTERGMLIHRVKTHAW